MSKEFVLVSQGIEIMRTRSQEQAINYVKKENDEWFKYAQRCEDNYENYADNYIDLEIEYSDEKEKDKEIERLNKENNDLRKLYQRTYKHLFDIGKDELASYLQAQIDECPTFYVEPIIDYYEECKKLNNIINEFDKWLIGEQMMFYKSDDGERLIRYAETTSKWLDLKEGK